MYVMNMFELEDGESWPIVSLRGSPTYELSKCLPMILHPLDQKSSHTINNTNAFLTNSKDLKRQADEIMISFKVPL